MRRYVSPLWPLMAQNLLNDSFRMSPRYFTKRRLVTEPFAWNVHGATTNTTAGTTSNSEDSYQARGKAPSSSGTPISQTNGVNVRLAITYEAALNESSTKYIQVTAEEAAEFIEELNEGAPFACLWSQGKTFVFPTGKIYGVLVEEADVPEVSESQGPEAATVGS